MHKLDRINMRFMSPARKAAATASSACRFGESRKLGRSDGQRALIETPCRNMSLALSWHLPHLRAAFEDGEMADGGTEIPDEAVPNLGLTG